MKKNRLLWYIQTIIFPLPINIICIIEIIMLPNDIAGVIAKIGILLLIIRENIMLINNLRKCRC